MSNFGKHHTSLKLLSTGVIGMIIITVFSLQSCAQENTVTPWADHEFGPFSPISFNEIPGSSIARLTKLFNKSNLIRSRRITHGSNLNLNFNPQSFFLNAKELFLIGELNGSIKSVGVNIHADLLDNFPLVITSNDEKRIEEIKLTHYGFYNAFFDFEANGIICDIQTIQQITREQQQMKLYQDIIQQYNSGKHLNLPQTILNKKFTIPRKAYETFKEHMLNPEYLDTVYFKPLRQSSDTLFYKGTSPSFIVFDQDHFIKENWYAPKRGWRYDYNEEKYIKNIHNISLSQSGFPLSLPNSTFQYDSIGLVSTVSIFDQLGKIRQTKHFEYQAFKSTNGFFKITVKGVPKQQQRILTEEIFTTEIIFDPQMNWIYIKKPNGEINRRISYL